MPRSIDSQQHLQPTPGPTSPGDPTATAHTGAAPRTSRTPTRGSACSIRGLHRGDYGQGMNDAEGGREGEEWRHADKRGRGGRRGWRWRERGRRALGRGRPRAVRGGGDATPEPPYRLSHTSASSTAESHPYKGGEAGDRPRRLVEERVGHAAPDTATDLSDGRLLRATGWLGSVQLRRRYVRPGVAPMVAPQPRRKRC